MPMAKKSTKTGKTTKPAKKTGREEKSQKLTIPEL